MATVKVKDVLEGLNRKINKRSSWTFATVAAALTAFKQEMREEGLRARITTEKDTYCFVGGTDDEHFVPVGASAFRWLTK